MPNGKHKTQIEHFKAQVKQHGGGDSGLLDWNQHGGIIGFEYEGKLYRVKVKRVESEVAMEQRMMHRAMIFIGLLQMLESGDILHIPTSEWKPRR